MNEIAGNLEILRQAIRKAAVAVRRAPDAVRLVAVSKGHDERAVRTAILAGQSTFGENRVQEAKAKFANVRREHPNLALHLIGPLQTNKVEEAVQLFDAIETLDRPALADALAKAVQKAGRAPKLYIEVNTGAEPQKAGIAPEALGDFLGFCKSRGLAVSGLMCIPPQAADPAPHFLRLKELASRHNLRELSMGMSADFEAAIRCGSTEVRIGTAIFGRR